MSGKAKRPNIILIMSDNHPAEMLGCYGNEEIHSPNLDRLASQGIKFNQAFCVNAMCSPCRASVLTGLMPSQHGIHTWLDDRIMEQWPAGWNAIGEFRSLPQILKDNGYKTALIGKYHLGLPFEPQNSFDYWLTFPHGHTHSFWGNTIIDNGRQYSYPGHTVDCFTEKAVEYIESHDPDGGRPFFLFLTYNGPYGHWPAVQGQARNRFAGLYTETEMKSVPREGLSDKAITRFLLRREASGGGIDYSNYLRIPNDLPTLRNYFSQMSIVDDGVGRVLAALEASGLEQETLVIYTCDHGFSLGHHGFWGHGQATWPANAHRAAYHIPLLFRHPGHIAPGREEGAVVSQIHLFATLLDYIGLGHLPANENAPSRSLASLLRGGRLEGREEAAEVQTGSAFIEQEEVRAIRTSKWVYMKRFKGSRRYPLEDELYDLENDPQEKHNLLADMDAAGAIAAVAADLSGRIEAFFGRYVDPAFDLWQGGTTKSNTDKPWLWLDAWGNGWAPTF